MLWDVCFYVVAAAVELPLGQLHAGSSFTWRDTGACGEMTGIPPGRRENPNSISWYCVTGNKILSFGSAFSSVIQECPYYPCVSREQTTSAYLTQAGVPGKSFHLLPFSHSKGWVMWLTQEVRAAENGPLSTPWRIHDFISSELRRQKRSFPFGHILWKLFHPFSKCWLD